MGEAKRRKLRGEYPEKTEKPKTDKQQRIHHSQFVRGLGRKLPNGVCSYVDNEHGRFHFVVFVDELQKAGHGFESEHLIIRNGAVYAKF